MANDRVQSVDEKPVSGLQRADVENTPSRNAEKEDPVMMGALRQMDTLDERVNLGRPMPLSVRQEYDQLISSHEQQPQSQTDREIALAARMRVLEHQSDAGDRNGCLQSQLELLAKYPESADYRRFLAIAGKFDFGHDPAFQKAFAGASDDAKSRLVGFSQLSTGEKADLDAGIKKMDKLDGDYDDLTNLRNGYTDIIGEHERSPQSRVDRQIASAGRMRITEWMKEAGESPQVIQQYLNESMDRYPEMSRWKNFVSTAAVLGLDRDPDFVSRFTAAGGDVDRLRQFARN